jgi:hypothetical protein
MRDHSPLVSVHRLRIKCRECGHGDNCAATEDGTRTYCRRVRSDYQGKDGGWLHIYDDAAPPPAPRPLVKPKPAPAPLADRRIRHDVYTAFLRSLTIEDLHTQNLIKRGLSMEAIVQGLFKTKPNEYKAKEIISNLGCDFSGIPGFYKDLGEWRMVKLPSGYFIPVRDRAGFIQALQMRRDYVQSPRDARYLWLSSRGRFMGTSPGSPIHIQNPERIAVTGRAIVTEGALKSFIAAQHLPEDDGGLIALAGVSTFRNNLGQLLKEAWPNLTHASIAFDLDWKVKREVRGQLNRLIRVLKGSFESISILEWEHEKGLDDYLVAEEGDEVAEVA